MSLKDSINGLDLRRQLKDSRELGGEVASPIPSRLGVGVGQSGATSSGGIAFPLTEVSRTTVLKPIPVPIGTELLNLQVASVITVVDANGNQGDIILDPGV